MVFESFRRQQKTFLAFLAIVAMIAFVLGSVFSNYAAPAPGSNVYFGETADGKGTPVEAYGRKISLAEIMQIREDRQKVSEFIRLAEKQARVIPNFQPFPLDDPRLVLGIVLARKAEKLGISPTDDDVRAYLDEEMEGKLKPSDFADILSGKINASGDPDAKPLKLSETRLFNALRRELAMNQAYRAITPPQLATIETPVDYWDSNVAQLTEISLNFIDLPVSKYIDANAQPTEQEMKETYNKYATVEAGAGAGDFGFLNPRRVDAQYFEAKSESFLAAQQVTDEEIAKYYEAHQTDFVETPTPTLDPAVPSTNPPAPPEEPGESPSTPPAPPTETPPSETPTTPEPAPSAPPESPEPAEPATPTVPEQPANPETPATPPTPEPTPQISAKTLTNGVEAVSFIQAEPAPPAPTEEKPPVPADAKDPVAEPAPAEPMPAETPASTPPAVPAPTTPPAPSEVPADPLDLQSPAPPTEPLKAPEPPKVKPLEQVKEEIRTILLKQKAGDVIKNAMQEVIDKDLTPYYFEKYKPARFAWASSHRSKDGTVDWSGFKAPSGVDFEGIAAKQSWELKATGLLTSAQLEKMAGLGKSTRVDRRQANKDVPESATQVLFDGEESEDLYAPRILFDAESETYFTVWKTNEVRPSPMPFEEVKSQVIEAWRLEKAREQAKKVAEELVKKAKESENKLEAALPNPEEYKVQTTESFPRTRSLPIGGNVFQPMLIPVTIANIPQAGEPFLDAVFALKEGEVSAVPNEDVSHYYIVKVATRKEPEFSKFASDYRLGVSMVLQQALRGESRMQSIQGLLVPDIFRDAGIDPAVFQQIYAANAPSAN